MKETLYLVIIVVVSHCDDELAMRMMEEGAFSF
jgi:hypothetical protein